MLSKLVSSLCWWIVRKFPGRYRIIGDGGTPYLGRFYLKHNGILPGVYLHHFYRSDQDRELHNHPWQRALSIVLTGGYYEYRYDSKVPIETAGFVHSYDANKLRMRDRKAPGFNVIKQTTFHRITLKDPKRGAWTLFMPGAETKDWGFLDRTTGRYTPHAEFLGEKFWDVSPDREASQEVHISSSVNFPRTGRFQSKYPNITNGPKADK